MAIIKGFKAIRPTRDKAYLVASRSYVTYSEETLREKLLNNPYTFLHIINPPHSDPAKSNQIEPDRNRSNQIKPYNTISNKI